MFEVSIEGNKTVLRITGEKVTQTICQIIFEMFTLVDTDIRYKLCAESGAEFTVNPTKMYTPNRFILVTFTKPEGAQAFVDYINEHTFLKTKKTVLYLMRLAKRFRQADARTNYDETYKDLQNEIYKVIEAVDSGKVFIPAIKL